MTCKNANCDCKKPAPQDRKSYVSVGDWQDNLKTVEQNLIINDAGDSYSLVKTDVITVLIKKLPNAFALPAYKSAGAAAMDLYATESVELLPATRAIIGTGIALAIPPGYEGQVRARSGLAARGIIVINSPGTIDCDFTGEIKVLLANLGTITAEEALNNEQSKRYAQGQKDLVHPSSLLINRGDRIAQLVIAPVSQASLREVDDLEATIRGNGGFGSTGMT